MQIDDIKFKKGGQNNWMEKNHFNVLPGHGEDPGYLLHLNLAHLNLRHAHDPSAIGSVVTSQR